MFSAATAHSHRSGFEHRQRLAGREPKRARSIEQRAAALTLYVLAVILVGGYVVALIRGSGVTTWATLCGALGATYMLSTVILTRRS